MQLRILKGVEVIIYIALLVSLSVLCFAQETTTYNPSKGYTSWLPAPKADDAMLLGNGTMGAMVFGHPHNETIIMNHANLYLPTGMPKQPINQVAKLDEIRQLILEGKGVEAAEIPVALSMEEGYGGQAWSDPYIPAFDIKIKTTPGNITSYQRCLDFETGVAKVNWEQNGKQFERKQFISRADSLMVIIINADTTFDATISFEQRPVAWNQWEYINENIKKTVINTNQNTLYYHSEFVHQWEGNIAGFNGVGKVLSASNEMVSNGKSVTAINTNQVILLIKIDTYKMGEMEKSATLLTSLEKNSNDFDTLLANHKKVHSQLFNRVNIDLNGADADLELDTEVMMQESKSRYSPAFVEKQFYASRYNILSATGTNPPNLQGIWGSEWQPPWTSDYTHDGNLPVAISSYLMSGMPELMMSYFDYHDARLPYYKDNAKKLYGCRGIQIPSHSSSHGWNVHFDPTWCLSFWNGGAAWAAHFYYDYWLYTNDKEFLKDRAYPFLKEAALFYEDFLTLGDDNKYVFNPSYSPENHSANNASQASINATMDVMLVKELLRNLISTGKILKENKTKIKQWESMLSKLPAYEVDKNGMLREWLWDGYEENHKHRHISHLYGLYDIIDPEIKNNPELIVGAQKAMEERMKIRRNDNGGIMVFGMVQMAWVAANLGDKQMTEEIITWLSAQYWSNSLATYHDPNGLFNMDLSGGFQTAIIRTLIYTEPGLIKLFPAKPESFSKGSISGIKGRNQITIEHLNWNTTEINTELTSAIKQTIQLETPENTEEVWVDGKKVAFNKPNSVYLKLNSDKTLNIKLVTK